MVRARLDAEGVPHAFDEVDGLTRLNVMAYETASGRRTRIYLPVPRVDPAHLDDLISEGDAGPSIVNAARTLPSCLIVMSTHGRSGLGRWIYGSVADEVIRTAEVPVALVPAACQR